MKKRDDPGRRVDAAPPSVAGGGEPLIPVGALAGTHGVRGELRVKLFNPGSNVLADATEVLLARDGGAAPRSFTVRRSRPHGAVWLLELESIGSIEAAAALDGERVLVREADLEPLAAGEFYTYQLVGLDVVDEGGRVLGPVREIVSAGGNDVLSVDVDGRERMIPMVDGIVRSVDLEARVIVVRPIEGLLEV